MSAVDEHLCNAIYNAIEDGNLEKAAKLCLSPNLKQMPLAQSLLSYCYTGLKRPEESLQLARQVLEAMPTETAVLNPISHTFRQWNQEHEMAEYYEKMLVTYPGWKDAEWLLELFFQYVRLDNAKKMQLTAQRLYKVKATSNYLFWSIASMLEQQDLPAAMLVVAERMIRKLFYETNPTLQPGAEELELFVEVLLRKGETEAALKALDEMYARAGGTAIKGNSEFELNGSLVKLQQLRYSMLRVDLLRRLGTSAHKEEEMLELRKVLERYPDQWDAHERLARGCLERAVADSTEVGDDTQKLERLAAALVEHRAFLQGFQSRHARLRGPYLAELALLILYRRLAIRIDSSSNDSSRKLPPQWHLTPAPASDIVPEAGVDARDVDEELGRLIKNYIDRFQTKQCCFSDVKKYVEELHNFAPVVISRLERWATTCAGVIEAELRFKAEEFSRAAAAAAAFVTEFPPAPQPDDAAGPPPSKSKKKKNKNKGVAASTGTETGTDSASAAVPVDPAQEAARAATVEMLCSFSKMEQIAFFCSKLLGGETRATLEQLRSNIIPKEGQSVDLYDCTKALCSGGIGGEREVQPGDEMLLLCSWMRKRGFSDAASESEVAEAGAGAGGASASLLLRTARWMRLLMLSCRASPFSYAFAVEVLDPMRIANAAEPALVKFHSLKVRYVQCDSLSYLILPALFESGLFEEASGIHMSVCDFHRKGKNETKEMIANCFRYCNYNKGLELRRFISRCKLSSQQAVSKAELPLLRLVLVHKTADSAKSYLSAYVQGKLVESQPLLSDDDLAALVDNYDYGLIMRADASGPQEEDEAATRRRQHLARVSLAQSTLWMLHHAFEGEAEKAQPFLSKLIASASSAPSSMSAGTYMQWDQGINGGGAAFETSVWEALRVCSSFCLASIVPTPKAPLAAASSSSGSAEAQGALSEEEKQELAQALHEAASRAAGLTAQCVEVIVALRQSLGLGLEGQGSSIAALFLPPPSDATPMVAACAPLDPDWVRRVALLSRTLGCWVPLLLQSLCARCSMMMGTLGETADIGSLRSSVLTVITCLSSFMARLRESLREIEDRLRAVPDESALPFFQAWDALRQKDAHVSSESERVDTLLLEAYSQVGEQLISSQLLSITKLRTVVSSFSHLLLDMD